MKTSLKQSASANGLRAALLFGVTLLPLTHRLLANPVGGEPPSVCLKCSAPPTYSFGSAGGSFTEGNFRDALPISSVTSSSGKTLDLNVTYNSYNADGSHAQVDTGLGYGWTHAYNSFLFSQVGAMFRMDQNGRTEKFQAGPGGTYTSDTGYFETLVKNGDGSFTLTDKNQMVYQFATVPGTPFVLSGPLYRLQSIKDQNGNTTTLTYSGGNLSAIKDSTGRALTMGYNASGHLTSVADPMGRTTTFAYDGTGHHLSSVTDPEGKTTQYTYNSLSQITTKVDGDGRTFTYQYQGNLPAGIKDGHGAPLYSLANPNGWETSFGELAAQQERVYTPSTTSQTDGRGNVWQYQYNSQGYPTAVTDPDGNTTRYTYDPGTLGISSKTDADGNVTTYQYDGQGNRTQMTDAGGNVTTYAYEPTFNQMISMTDPNGRTTTYQYDPSNGNLTKETDPKGDTRTWTYDGSGDMLTYTDKRGKTTTYAYDGSRNRTSMTDALGHQTTYTYDGVGNLITTTDPLGHTTTYSYDGLNRLTSQTDAAGDVTSYGYNAAGDRISVTDANAHTTTYTYDYRDRMITRTDATGHHTTMTYDGNNDVIQQTDELGRVTTYSYDGENRRISATDALHGVSSSAYDPVGNLTRSVDANGHATTYTYDALNRRTTQTDPLGNTTTYDYAANSPGPACCGASAGSSLVTEQVDGNGKITFYHYDELNRRVSEVHKSSDSLDVTNVTDAVTATAYDADNNVTATTDPNGNTTSFTYDALDRQVTSTDPAGDTTTTTYDAAGRLYQTTAVNGNVTTHVYDAANRLTQTSDLLGVMTSYSYDAVGNVTQVTDGNGNGITYAYDPLNRITSATDALGHSRSATYDAVGNVLTVTDRNGNTTHNTYDALNRLTHTTDPLAHQTTTTYDAVGNRLTVTDANGHTTRYLYDSDNRLQEQTYADHPSDSLTYTYDAVGHRLTRLDANGVTTTYTYNDFYYLTERQYSSGGPADVYTYDLGGRMLSATRDTWVDSFTYDAADRVLTSVQDGRTVSYAYDLALGTRTVTYPGGRVITEQMDQRSRLAEVEDGGTPAIASFTYDAANNVLQRNNRNGTAATYTYNANNWVLTLAHTKAGPTLVAGFSYAYDNEGNKLSEDKPDNPTESEAYAYDGLDRLTSYRVGSLSGNLVLSPSIAKTWTLDPVGNWSSLVSNSGTQTRHHNAVNEITSINAQGLSYDADGNLINDGEYEYAYDGENRLTEVTRITGPVVVAEYMYDALGHRVAKVASPLGGPGTETLFFYDGSRLIEEEDSSFVTQATYTYGNYIDEVLTMDRGGNTYYYHPNALYSVEALTDSTGTPAERYRYDAYGQVSVSNGSYTPVTPNSWGTPHSAVGNPFLFTGRQLDEETGLYYYRTRYYDSLKGRFLQRDPVGYADSLNLYEYAHSEPTKGLDATGTTCTSVDRTLVIKNPTKRLPPVFVGPVPVTLSFYAQVEATVKGQTCDVKCPNGQPGQTTELTLSATGKVGVSVTLGLDRGFNWADFEVSAWAGLRGEAEVGFTLKGTYTQCTCKNGPKGITVCGEFPVKLGIRGGGEAVFKYSWWSWTLGVEVFGTLNGGADMCFDWTGDDFKFQTPKFKGWSGEYGIRFSMGGSFTVGGTF